MKGLGFVPGEFSTFDEQIIKCRLSADEARASAHGACGEKAEQYVDFAARWSELADEMERFVVERTMKTADASAIAGYLNEDGQILKIPEAALVTTQDVLDYLKSSGVAATGSGSEPNVYYCEGKRMNLSKILELANHHRRAECLQPFAIRV